MPDDSNGEFRDWRRFLIETLKELREVQKELEHALYKRLDDQSKELAVLRTELAVLKVKSTGWGALAGIIGGVIISAK